MTNTSNTSQAFIERTAWWLRSDMGLRDATDPPVPGLSSERGRCDLHAIGHARAATNARFIGFMLAILALIAFMFGARPASADSPSRGSTPAIVGTTLGSLSVAGFVAGRVLERRTRYHVWLQCEARTINRGDVLGTLDAVDAVRGRGDRAWNPDQVWVVAAEFTPEAASLARERGVRCFVRQRSATREV